MSYCIYCESSEAVRPLILVHRRQDEQYYKCYRCGLVFRDQPKETYKAPRDLEQLNEEDRKKFSQEYIEQIDITDGQGRLYPNFKYRNTEKMKSAIVERALACLQRHLPSRQNPAVLEVGCATGFLAAGLQDHFPESDIYGLDPSPVSIKEACQQDSRPHFLVGTMEDVELPQNYFDAAFCIGNLMLHRNPLATLAHIHRALKPGGILLFDVKNLRTLLRQFSIMLYKVPLFRETSLARYIIARSFGNMRYTFTRKTISDGLRKLGYEILDMHTIAPRLLEFDNAYHDTHNLRGMLWRIVDKIDAMRDERAWLEVCSRKPETAECENNTTVSTRTQNRSADVV